MSETVWFLKGVNNGLDVQCQRPASLMVLARLAGSDRDLIVVTVLLSAITHIVHWCPFVNMYS